MKMRRGPLPEDSNEGDDADQRTGMNAAARTIATDPAADARFMALALVLGRRGLGNTWPNPAVGAVVVRHEVAGPRIVGRGWTQRGGRPHAEIEALNRAAGQARGATLYVTLEPCSHHGKSPPCTDAIIAAGIARVVSALEDPNPLVAGQGHARLTEHGVRVETGIGREAALLAHAGHIRRVRHGRPHVTLKLAASADGKAGLSGRRPIAITADAARDRVHLLRARNDAILVGIGTALADDPMLTCRLPGMASYSPLRIVLDCHLRLPPAGRLGRSACETPVWVVAGRSASAAREAALIGEGVEIMRVNEMLPGRLDLAAMTTLVAARGITRLMVEGGPTVAASFISADLIDEALLFRSQKIIGPDGIDALEGLPLSALTASPRLRSLGIEAVGPDLVETFVRAQSCSPAS
jgi:diaminohydroxyphosphoribosylaminopyrimidine deaminase/5-amino-6-(5-phosphoribosylamino)uracil reductase